MAVTAADEILAAGASIAVMNFEQQCGVLLSYQADEHSLEGIFDQFVDRWSTMVAEISTARVKSLKYAPP